MTIYMVQATWSPIPDTRGGCPYVPDYYFSFFNNTVLILITNDLHKQNTALILITNYYFSFFNDTALINVFFFFRSEERRVGKEC